MTHENTYDSTPVIGYGDGLVKGQGAPSRIDNNDWIVIGMFRFNVHPYRSDLGGYPVRWIEEADGDHRAVTPRQATQVLATEQEFFDECWRSFKFDVTKLLRQKGMTAIAATAAVLQLNEAACGDLTPAQTAQRIIEGATK